MTSFKYRYVHKFRDRHGRVRYYFRRAGFPLTPLPGEPDSREFREAHEACLVGKQKIVIGADKVKAGSLNSVAVLYYKSPAFNGLEESTKATYRGGIERLREKYGDLPIASMRKKHVAAIRDAMATKPTAANFAIRMLRLLMDVAIEREMRDDDPTFRVKKVKVKSDGFHTWTEDELEEYEQFYPLATKERLAYDLLLYTAQRGVDVRLMGRQHLKRGYIMVRAIKTKSTNPDPIVIPIHPKLQTSLSFVPADQMLFLLNHFGKPFSQKGFQNFFSEACRKAGLPKGVTAHGLRKVAACRLAEAGCSEKQIAAITGHETLKEVARYTKRARQKRLADAAMRKQIKYESAPHDDDDDDDDDLANF